MSFYIFAFSNIKQPKLWNQNVENINIFNKHVSYTTTLKVIAMKDSSTLPRSPDLEIHHQIKLNIIPMTLLLIGVLNFSLGDK